MLSIWFLTFAHRLNFLISALELLVSPLISLCVICAYTQISAAYPDGHPDLGSSADDELLRLKEKVDAGADFIVTQLFYDADNFLVWLGKVRKMGMWTRFSREREDELTHFCDAGITIPVIPGVMPIQTYSSFLRLTKLCGVRVPESVIAALEPIKVCTLLPHAAHDSNRMVER